MGDNNSFKDCVVIACGTISPELNYLKKDGFLDAIKIIYTTPGLHEIPRELEKQLIDNIKKARELSNKIIVLYGGQFCYINSYDVFRTIDTIIGEQGEGITRIQASHCVDMIVGKKEREEIVARILDEAINEAKKYEKNSEKIKNAFEERLGQYK